MARQADRAMRMLVRLWWLRATILASKGAYMGRSLHKSCPIQGLFCGWRTQQEEAGQRKRDSQKPGQRGGFLEEHDFSDCHNGTASSQDHGHCRKRSALLKQQKEKNGSDAHANSGDD